jgi:pentatricopeptide repeat protein
MLLPTLSNSHQNLSEHIVCKITCLYVLVFHRNTYVCAHFCCNAFSLAGSRAAAFALLDEMKAQNIAPDALTFDSLLLGKDERIL